MRVESPRVWPAGVELHSGGAVGMVDVRDYCRARGGEFCGSDVGSLKRFGCKVGEIRISFSLEAVEFWRLTGRF